MKNYVVLLLAALWASSPSAFAIQMKDLLGTWRGKHQETRDGQGWAYKITLIGEKLPDGTIRLIERGTLYDFVSTYTFRKDGQFKARATTAEGAVILSSYRGTWKSRDGRISISAKGSNGRLAGALSDTATGIRFTGNTDHIRVVVSARR